MLIRVKTDIITLLPNDEGVAGSNAGGAPKKGPSLWELATTKSVVICSLVFIFQQFSGINAIMYYSSLVFAQVRTRDELRTLTSALYILGTQHACCTDCAALRLGPLRLLLRISCSSVDNNPSRQKHNSHPVRVQAGVKSQALASAAVGVINVLGTVVAGSLLVHLPQNSIVPSVLPFGFLSMCSQAMYLDERSQADTHLLFFCCAMVRNS